MLATRIIPTILQRNGALVKGQKYDAWRSVGNVLTATRIHSARGVDEIIYLDIGATPQQLEPNYDLIAKITEGMWVPLTVGGGIRSLDHIRSALAYGADKVAIGWAARKTPDLIFHAARSFGSQAIVVSLDVRGGLVMDGPDHRGCPVHTAREYERLGAGEILLNSVDGDGTMAGYDQELLRAVSSAVRIPVVASGGCSGYADMAKAIDSGAFAVAAGALFQFTECTPRGAAEYLNEHGYTVRL